MTLTSNNSKNIRARKKSAGDNLFASFYSTTWCLCSFLLTTDMATRGHKDDRKKLSRSTMTSFNLEIDHF